MNIFELTERLAGKMKWYDFSLLKASVFFFTLFLLTVWDGFRIFVLGVQWYWYLVLAVIVAIPLWKKMFAEFAEMKDSAREQGKNSNRIDSLHGSEPFD